MIPTRLTRRTAFRLTVLVAALISVTNIVIFSVLYIVINQQLSTHLEAHVGEVMNTLTDVEETGGLDALAKMVTRHAAVAQADEDIFLLTDTDGKYLAGNIRPIPVFSGWKSILWEDLPLIGEWSTRRTSTSVVGLWADVKGGHLFVGDGNGDINEAQFLLLKGLLYGVSISILSAIGGGLLLGLNAQRRIMAMERALNAVASGQLQERVPRSSSADDIDHVASLINTTLDRLESLIANLKQVSGDIAHDLRTPINRMRQRLEMLQESKSDLPTFRGAVDDTVREIDGIAETFDAILRISEIESGARKSRFGDVDLGSVLRNVVDALEAVAEEHGDAIHAILAANKPLIHGDRQLLSQLFTNLIENAIVHCPTGSKISVALRSTGDEIIAAVADNGPGIPESERDKVFRRLYRLEKSRSTPGNGLGLSLVAAIAELHQAKVQLSDNKPGLKIEVTFAARQH
jgi:signal transduction histidine kinase